MQFRLVQRYSITRILVKLITYTNGNIIPIKKQCKQITCFFHSQMLMLIHLSKNQP